MSRLELGLIDGDFWAATHVDQIEAAINEVSLAGEIKMYIGTSAPSGYLLMNGQVVPTAQVDFPDLWAVAPAAWKSGTSLTLPNMAARLPIGQDGSHAIGAVGGANTKTIAEANLPTHHHALSGNTADTTQNHVHGTGDSFGGFVTQSTAGGPSAFDISAGTGAIINTQIQTSGATLTHNHGLTGNTGDVGSGTAFDVTPAWVAVSFIIRAF